MTHRMTPECRGDMWAEVAARCPIGGACAATDRLGRPGAARPGAGEVTRADPPG